MASESAIDLEQQRIARTPDERRLRWEAALRQVKTPRSGCIALAADAYATVTTPESTAHAATRRIDPQTCDNRPELLRLRALCVAQERARRRRRRASRPAAPMPSNA